MVMHAWVCNATCIDVMGMHAGMHADARTSYGARDGIVCVLCVCCGTWRKGLYRVVDRSG